MRMRSGNHGRGSALAFCAGGFGLLLVAAIEACSGRTGAPTAAIAAAKPSNPPCITVAGQLVGKGKEFPETAVIKHMLYKVADFANEDLGTGKWIGVVHRIDGQKDPSSVFPGLEAMKWGCVLFVQFQEGLGTPPVAEAFFMLAGNTIPVRMRNAVVCMHPDHPHDPDVEPDVLTDPADCGLKSRVVLSTTLLRPGGDKLFNMTWTASGRGIVQDFKDSVVAFRDPSGPLTGPEITTIDSILSVPGPWFPCALTGCCRAF